GRRAVSVAAGQLLAQPLDPLGPGQVAAAAAADPLAVAQGATFLGLGEQVVDLALTLQGGPSELIGVGGDDSEGSQFAPLPVLRLGGALVERPVAACGGQEGGGAARRLPAATQEAEVGFAQPREHVSVQLNARGGAEVAEHPGQP